MKLSFPVKLHKVWDHRNRKIPIQELIAFQSRLTLRDDNNSAKLCHISSEKRKKTKRHLLTKIYWLLLYLLPLLDGTSTEINHFLFVAPLIEGHFDLIGNWKKTFSFEIRYKNPLNRFILRNPK